MEKPVVTSDVPTQTDSQNREASESFAIEGYRAGTFSHYQAGRMLGLSRFEFDGFLKDRGIEDHAYGISDLEEDLKTLNPNI